MLPKKSIENRRVSTSHLKEQMIPIYEVLSNKQIREPMLDLLPQIESSLTSSPLALKISFLNMLVRLCGLEEYSSDIGQENTLEALHDVLDKAYSIKKTELNPLILDTKNKFQKELVKRLRQFLQAIMSEELKIVSDNKVQFNSSFLAWLQILAKSKLRVIRNASVQFTRILVEEEIRIYEHFHEIKQSKKAFNIAKNIGYYLQKIFCPRLNDIDQSIRQSAFQITETILGELEGDILTQNLLNKIFTPLFDEDAVILDRIFHILYKLLTKCKNLRPLIDYLKDHLHKIMQVSRSTIYAGTNVQALKIIEILHHNNPSLKLINRNYMVSVLQNYAPTHMYYALHGAVEVFYQSLYSNGQQLQLNSTIVLIQIINLLLGVTNKRNIPIILKMFFVSTKKIQSFKIFNIDNMFTLLMSEYYRDEKNNDIRLKDAQTQVLLTITTHWIRHSVEQYKHLIKDKVLYEKILESYNTHILINCKQLFFDKMTKHHNFSDKYLSLFAHIHTPTLTHSSLEDYLNFVSQKTEKLFSQDLQNCSIYKEIANIFHNLSKEQQLGLKYSVKTLIGKMGLVKVLEQNKELSEQQIFRISSVLSKFPMIELAKSQNFLNNLIKTFAQSKKEKDKMQIILITHLLHHYNFMELFKDSSQVQQQIYKLSRTKILGLYTQIIANAEEPGSVKLSAFRGLTYVMQMISSSKFQQTPSSRINAYELAPEQMQMVYEYVTKQLYNTDSLDYSSLDISVMLQSLSLESHEIKNQIIRLLFDLYETSYVFTCHPESIRFLVSLIKGESQLQKETFVRSPSLPISFDLSKQIQKRLNQLLDSYLLEETKQANQNRLIYWRLCHQIFNESRSDQKFEIILDRLLSSYFSKKKLDPDQKKRLNNKLMIFILHAVDKILERKEYINLDIYENILKKIHKKFEKEVLIRIKEFLIQKTEGIDNPYVKSFLEMIQSIARVQIKRSKKQENNEESSEDEQNVQNQEDNQEEQGKINRDIKNMGQNKNKKVGVGNKKNRNQIMQVQQSEDEEQNEARIRRNTRSQTKKKIH